MEDQNKENKIEETKETEDLEIVSNEVVEEEKEKVEEYNGKQATSYICYDYKTLKAFTMYNTVVKRKGAIKYLVLGIIAFLAAVYVIVNAIIQKKNSTEEMNIVPSIMMGGICCLFSIYIIIQSFQFESQVDKAIIRHYNGRKNYNEQNIIVREDKVTIIPLSHVKDKYDYEWYQITSIEDIPGYIVLFSGKMPIIIEKDASKIVNGNYDDLMDIIKDNVSKKPFKKYEKPLYKKPIPKEYENEATPKYYVDVEKEEAEKASAVEEVEPIENNENN